MKFTEEIRLKRHYTKAHPPKKEHYKQKWYWENQKMKTRLLIIFALVLFSSLIMINEADALIVTLSLENLAEKAEFVVIGKVIDSISSLQ